MAYHYFLVKWIINQSTITSVSSTVMLTFLEYLFLLDTTASPFSSMYWVVETWKKESFLSKGIESRSWKKDDCEKPKTRHWMFKKPYRANRQEVSDTKSWVHAMFCKEGIFLLSWFRKVLQCHRVLHKSIRASYTEILKSNVGKVLPAIEIQLRVHKLYTKHLAGTQ